jgi:hypothetical protein
MRACRRRCRSEASVRFYPATTAGSSTAAFPKSTTSGTEAKTALPTGILSFALTVDEFVETKVQPELRPIVSAIRSLIRECAPKAAEVIGYGMPIYKGKKTFAWISPSKKDITVGFSRGTQMEDKYDLLGGVSKGGSKHLRVRNLAELNKAALKYYVKQAVALDKR